MESSNGKHFLKSDLTRKAADWDRMMGTQRLCEIHFFPAPTQIWGGHYKLQRSWGVDTKISHKDCFAVT